MNFKIHTDCADPYPHTWEKKEESVETEVFDADYYLRGRETGKSNYENYRWMPEQTLAYAIYVQRHLGIQGGQSVLDVGCSRGYFVKALRMMGIEAFGQDISKWAIANCDPDVVDYVSNELSAEPMSWDWVTLKDACEHIEKKELEPLIQKLSAATRRGILIIVPLSAYTGGRYIRDEDEMDKTHVHRWTLNDWMQFLMDNTKDFTVSGSYYIKGIKECCKAQAMSCGFLTLTRI